MFSVAGFRHEGQLSIPLGSAVMNNRKMLVRTCVLVFLLTLFPSVIDSAAAATTTSFT